MRPLRIDYACAGLLLLVLVAAAGLHTAGTRPLLAQEKKGPTEMEAQAKKSIEAFYAAWNKADNEALRKEMNFPFVSLFGGGRVTTSEKAADFNTDFDRMRQTERWHHSTLDKFEATSVTADAVHCKVTFSRYHEDGAKYMTMTMLYIVTKKNDHWGMQFRTPMSNE